MAMSSGHSSSAYSFDYQGIAKVFKYDYSRKEYVDSEELEHPQMLGYLKKDGTYIYTQSASIFGVKAH